MPFRFATALPNISQCRSRSENDRPNGQRIAHLPWRAVGYTQTSEPLRAAPHDRGDHGRDRPRTTNGLDGGGSTSPRFKAATAGTAAARNGAPSLHVAG